MKVLVAEDDPHIRQGLCEILAAEGYTAIAARDGAEALLLFTKQAPEFVCLDIMMPGVNGYDVCREIRRQRSDVPIVFISAKSQEIDKVIGLELGADDFIIKPFGVKEVVARIRAVTRRCLARQAEKSAVPTSFQFGDLDVFPAQLRARRGETIFELSLRDVRILELFMKHKGEVLDRNTIYNHGWGVDFFPNSRTLDQHISQLRKRIERDPKNPGFIQTVHGAGYRYDG